MNFIDILFWIVFIYMILAAIFGWPPFNNWPM